MFNGNITGIKWKLTDGANNTQNQKSYAFAYDKTDKLLSAAFKKTATANAETGTYDEAMTYDHNGNILGLTRKQNSRSISGTTITNTSQTIDNLSYTYTGNQLQKVDDASTTTAGFSDGSATTTEYIYDTHGNMKTDANKGVSNITYNVLGKANLVTMTNGTTIQYSYSAGGTKLATVTTVGSIVTTVNYVNGFVYNNSTMSYFSSPEGRVVKNGGSFEYQYAIQDHQGNTRVLFTSAAPTVETITEGFEGTPSPSFDYVCTNLFPFGHSGSYSTFLVGGDHSADVAAAKSKHVYPGDKVELSGFVNYNDYAWNVGSSLADYATYFITYFGLAVPGLGETHTASSVISSYGSAISGGYGDGSTDTTDPRVFFTILVFDKNYNLIDTKYQQLQGVDAWESMDVSYTAVEEGYIYAYVSNENPMKLSIFVDDVTFTYTPTRIIQSSEYYPYGMQTASSWTRDNSVGNNYLYNQGSELNATTAMYDLPYRNYDAALGRFFQVDPLAAQTHDMTAYQYANGNPVVLNDPLGLLAPNDPSLSYGQVRAMFYASGSSDSFENWFADSSDRLIGSADNPIADGVYHAKGGNYTVLGGQAYIYNRWMDEDVQTGSFVNVDEILSSDPEHMNEDYRDRAENAQSDFGKLTSLFTKQFPWDLDNDGNFTQREGNNWFRVGHGNSIHVDASKIRVPYLNPAKLIRNERVVVNMLTASGPTAFGAYGALEFVLRDSNRAEIVDNEYDYRTDDHSWIESPARNLETIIGRINAGAGTSFLVIFDGMVHIDNSYTNGIMTSSYINSSGLH